MLNLSSGPLPALKTEVRQSCTCNQQSRNGPCVSFQCCIRNCHKHKSSDSIFHYLTVLGYQKSRHCMNINQFSAQSFTRLKARCESARPVVPSETQSPLPSSHGCWLNSHPFSHVNEVPVFFSGFWQGPLSALRGHPQVLDTWPQPHSKTDFFVLKSASVSFSF